MGSILQSFEDLHYFCIKFNMRQQRNKKMNGLLPAWECQSL